MPVIANESRANFSLGGADFEPAESNWTYAPEAERRTYYRRLAELAYDAKLRELRRGVDVNGKKLKPIRIPRRDGSDGPPLSPHHASSRFQRRLGYTSTASRATLFWRGGWARVVGYHAAGAGNLPVRDVVGLSPAAQRYVREAARLWWRHRHGGHGPARLTMPGPLHPQPHRPKVPVAARPQST